MENKNIKNKRISKSSFGIYLGLAKEKEYLMENLSFLISSGMPVGDALRSILSELKSNFMKRVVGQAIEDVENGVPLYRALDDTGLFGVHEISLIKNHIGFYSLPTGNKAFEKKLSKYKVGKGSIQFPLDEPLPIKLIIMYILIS